MDTQDKIFEMAINSAKNGDFLKFSEVSKEIPSDGKHTALDEDSSAWRETKGGDYILDSIKSSDGKEFWDLRDLRESGPISSFSRMASGNRDRNFFLATEIGLLQADSPEAADCILASQKIEQGITVESGMLTGVLAKMKGISHFPMPAGKCGKNDFSDPSGRGGRSDD